MSINNNPLLPQCQSVRYVISPFVFSSLLLLPLFPSPCLLFFNNNHQVKVDTAKPDLRPSINEFEKVNFISDAPIPCPYLAHAIPIQQLLRLTSLAQICYAFLSLRATPFAFSTSLCPPPVFALLDLLLPSSALFYLHSPASLVTYYPARCVQYTLSLSLPSS